MKKVLFFALIILSSWSAMAEVPVQAPEPTSLALFGSAIAGVIVAKISKR